ncbi:hypothetical protein DFH09DRAFT_1338939 [Mycena vulgaris]|nr:hypothetical protein DFH09DRAFT_1338939 [Mycena vulgaris]
MLQIPPRAPESPPPLDNLYRDVPYESRARSGTPALDAAALALRRALSSQLSSDSRRRRTSSSDPLACVGASTVGVDAPSACIHALPPISSGDDIGRNKRIAIFTSATLCTTCSDKYSCMPPVFPRAPEAPSPSYAPPEKWSWSPPGKVVHTLGWQLGWDTYGGGWEYHMADGLPHREFQRMKHHPHFHALLAAPGADRLRRSAGVINTAKIKGTHNAMRTEIPSPSLSRRLARRLAVALMSHFLSFTAHHPSIYFFYSYFPFPALFYPASARCSNPTRTGIPAAEATLHPAATFVRFHLIVATFKRPVASPSSPSSARLLSLLLRFQYPRSNASASDTSESESCEAEIVDLRAYSTASDAPLITAPTPPARTDLWTVGPGHATRLGLAGSVPGWI